VSRRLQLILGILVSVVCLWWAMREVRLSEVWSALQRADWRGFFAVMGATLLGFWIRAFRWRWLLSTTRRISLGSLYRATMIGFMANNLLPFRLGEFVRAWALGRRENLSKTTVFATVVVERVVDMITLLAIFGISLLLHPIASTTEAGRITNAGATTLLLACVGLTVFLVVIERSPRLMGLLIERVARWAPERARQKAVSALSHFVEGLGLFRDLPRLLWVFALSFVMFGAFALSLQASMWALHLPVPWYSGLVMLVITAIGIMVPAAPGYIGTLQFACVAGLALFGIDKELANAFSWFYWAGQWLPVSMVGLWCLRLEGLGLASLGKAQENAA
jgi:glycosyltransferase 2 family protein